MRVLFHFITRHTQEAKSIPLAGVSSAVEVVFQASEYHARLPSYFYSSRVQRDEVAMVHDVYHHGTHLYQAQLCKDSIAQ